MDCVGCSKCRLWGKVQTTGVATALKVLFELDETALQPHSQFLQRTELVALMNTLYRFSESLKAVDDFRQMWRNLDADESHSLAAKAEAAATMVVRDVLCCQSLGHSDVFFVAHPSGVTSCWRNASHKLH